MKKGVWVVCLVILLAQATYAKERNITEKVVLLDNGAMKIRFHNMGVDANWGNEILNNAAKALPYLEDTIGVNFPPQVESVEIYGTPAEGGMFSGDNDGKRITIFAAHPADPTYIYHELVHYWTIYYDVPWALSEGYCVLYSYLVAKHFGENVVAYRDFKLKSIAAFESEIKEDIIYLKTDKPRGLIALNSFDYRKELDEKKVDYFYGMSSAIMFALAGVYEGADFKTYGIGTEKLKEVNRKMMSSKFDSSVSGIGTLQYIELLRDMMGKNMADLFLPVFFSSWDDASQASFVKSFSYLSSVKIITGSATNPNIDTGMKELAGGNPDGANNFFNMAIKSYYEEKAKPTPSPTLAPTPAPVTGFRKLVSTITGSSWFLPLVLVGVIVIIFGVIGIYLYTRARKEGEFDKYMEEIRNE